MKSIHSSDRSRAARGLVLGLALVPAAVAQQPPPPSDPTPAPAAESAPPPAWPELDAAARRHIDKICQELRRTKKAERRDELEAELIAIGAGAAPFLLGKLSDRTVGSTLNDSLGRVLTDITTAEHAPLLAPCVRDAKRAVRGWTVARLTDLARPELAPVFRQALADQDPEIAFQARLGLTATGDPGELDAILARARDGDWEALQPRLARALPPARGGAAMQHVLDAIRGADDRTQVAGLRLLRWLTPAEGARALTPYLDAEAHAVKKAAINALRVSVDGAAPLEQLAVFSAIEQANAWKARLQ